MGGVISGEEVLHVKGQRRSWADAIWEASSVLPSHLKSIKPMMSAALGKLAKEPIKKDCDVSLLELGYCKALVSVPQRHSADICLLWCA